MSVVPVILGRRIHVVLDEGTPVVSYKKLVGVPAAVPVLPAAVLAEEPAVHDAEGESGGDGDEEQEEEGEGGADASPHETQPQRRNDWYDVNDGFVDDSEALGDDATGEGAAKFDGFYVNKGEIEREPGAVRPEDAPSKKRKLGSTDEVPPPKPQKAGLGEPRKVKRPVPPFDGTGALGAAVAALQDIVARAQPPPPEQERRSLTVEMTEGLERIRRILVPGAELPRGLTSRLMEFMEPFAGGQTLRRRLDPSPKGSAGGGVTAAQPAVSVKVLAMPAPIASAPALLPPSTVQKATAVPLGPPPSAEEVERGLAALRAVVASRCDAARSAAPLPESAEEFLAQPFQWNVECEDALFTVLTNSQRMGKAAHKNAYRDLLASGIWPSSVQARMDFAPSWCCRSDIRLSGRCARVETRLYACI